MPPPLLYSVNSYFEFEFFQFSHNLENLTPNLENLKRGIMIGGTS